MKKTLVVFLVGVAITIWGILNEIAFFKIAGMIVAIILIVLGLFCTIGFILDKKNKNIKN